MLSRHDAGAAAREARELGFGVRRDGGKAVGDVVENDVDLHEIHGHERLHFAPRLRSLRSNS